MFILKIHILYPKHHILQEKERGDLSNNTYKRSFCWFFSLLIIHRCHMHVISAGLGRSTAGSYHRNSNPHLVWYCQKNSSLIYMIEVKDILSFTYYPFSQKCEIFQKTNKQTKTSGLSAKRRYFLSNKTLFSLDLSDYLIRFYYFFNNLVLLCIESLTIIY